MSGLAKKKGGGRRLGSGVMKNEVEKDKHGDSESVLTGKGYFCIRKTPTLTPPPPHKLN